MSRVCSICGKGKMKGNQVSNSNIKTLTPRSANLQKKTIVLDGKEVNAYVCTKCMKTAKKNG
ncbi:MAG: 50S ribosomal protein L28 [Clostridia bacterium]|nr:50S ribosomal protein L28 [Clostridia bacterium]